jgi:hypothetical protein
MQSGLDLTMSLRMEDFKFFHVHLVGPNYIPTPNFPNKFKN